MESRFPQAHRDMTNGVPDAPLQHPGSKVSGERTDSERQPEVTARQWTVSHLQDEMRYIREVSGAKGSRQPAARPSAGPLAGGPSSCRRRRLHAACLCTGKRLFGEGEGEDVRTVWRNAAVDAEAFAGNQGKNQRKHCSSMRPPVKLRETL